MPYEGHLVLSTHAPARFRFRAPAGARRITIEAGMLPGAYEPGPDASDGVEIIIAEAVTLTLHRELFRRPLNPLENISDRGIQTLQFEQDGPFAADVIITLAPGPAGSTARDWAYIKRIEFQ